MAADDSDAPLREAAQHRGLRLVKSRRRKPGSGDYGFYGLTDAQGTALLGFGPDGLTATADDIAAFLRKGAASTWAESARTTKANPKPPSAPKPPEEPARAIKTRKGAPKAEQRPRPAPKAEPEPEPPAPEPPTLAIRTAGKADAGAIATLVRRLHPDANGIEERIAAPDKAGHGVLVADKGGVIGCIAWAIVPTLQQGDVGRITALVVDPDERRSGIGRALIEALADKLATHGCTTIEAMSEIEIRAAHGFFRRTGFTQTSYRFARTITT